MVRYACVGEGNRENVSFVGLIGLATRDSKFRGEKISLEREEGGGRVDFSFRDKRENFENSFP